MPAHAHKPNILSVKAAQKIRKGTVFAQIAHQQSDEDDQRLDICQNRPNDRLDIAAQLRPAGQPQLPGKLLLDHQGVDLNFKHPWECQLFSQLDHPGLLR